MYVNICVVLWHLGYVLICDFVGHSAVHVAEVLSVR
jgi:hypothetical protein